ncbi:MAG: hypothetical protein PHH93_04505 [Prolixibacteraceae bacterium]|nr:hypothetical protein [Prolixibacteraceae bacterium]
MKRLIALAFILSIFTISVTKAQNNRHEERWEKFRAEKAAFLSSYLELTPGEAQNFWPVYNQMEKERWAAQKLRREMEEKIHKSEESLSEKQKIALTRDFAGSMQKETDIMVKYNEKFLKILPPTKVLKLYNAENEFRMYMIKKYRDKRKSEN